jgi:hypothetical protein
MQRILKKYSLRVTDIASPLFKVDWKGAPRSRYSDAMDFHASFTFDFWRLDDQAPYHAAINQKLLDAANRAGKKASPCCWKMTAVLIQLRARKRPSFWKR